MIDPSPIVAFVIALVCARRLSRAGSQAGWLDRPNERSLHTRPVPRTGGVAIALGLAMGVMSPILLRGFDARWMWLASGALLLFVIAVFDDRGHVHPAARLAVQAGAAGAVLLTGLAPEALRLPGMAWPVPAAMSVVLTFAFVLWMVNLYNFMDGMDGFAGGMAVCGFGTLAWIAQSAGAGGFAILNVTVAAAAAGFLVFNFPPARLFMGDTGSTVLGFLAAVVLLHADAQGILPFWLGCVLFSPFIVDATLTLLARLLRGERVWQAHREHAYQRLVCAGWGHRRTVLAEYALMALCAAGVVWGREQTVAGQWVLLGVVVVVYAGLWWAVGRVVRSLR